MKKYLIVILFILISLIGFIFFYNYMTCLGCNPVYPEEQFIQNIVGEVNAKSGKINSIKIIELQFPKNIDSVCLEEKKLKYFKDGEVNYYDIDSLHLSDDFCIDSNDEVRSLVLKGTQNGTNVSLHKIN